MNRTTRLKQLIQAKEIVVMPGVYDVLSAMIAEKCGVKAVQVTGYGLAGSNLGYPDVGIMTKTQMVELVRNICNRDQGFAPLHTYLYAYLNALTKICQEQSAID